MVLARYPAVLTFDHQERRSFAIGRGRTSQAAGKRADLIVHQFMEERATTVPATGALEQDGFRRNRLKAESCSRFKSSEHDSDAKKHHRALGSLRLPWAGPHLYV